GAGGGRNPGTEAGADTRDQPARRPPSGGTAQDRREPPPGRAREPPARDQPARPSCDSLDPARFDPKIQLQVPTFLPDADVEVRGEPSQPRHRADEPDES